MHVNRSIRVLRDDGLIVLKQRWMHVPDPERLAALCDFKPDYLHLAPARAMVMR